MPTYPLPTLAATVTPTGISAPAYVDILASLQASFRVIFGDDAYLEPDGQDGQLLAVFALAIHDANQMAVAVYNSYSPATALGAGLSSAVKINHMQRLVATHSQVNLTIGGTVGTLLNGAVVGDSSGNRWIVPDGSAIPLSGELVITATAEAPGNVTAAAGSCTVILTPIAGWSTVTNDDPASPGQAVETDAQLRLRQENAPSLLAMSVLPGLKAALQALSGVDYVAVYENDTNSTDARGIPAHSIAVVVQGGVAYDIARTIYAKKTPGASTYGTTTIGVPDVTGTLRNINFFVPTLRAVKVAIQLHATTAYTTAVADMIKQAVADFVNALLVGNDVIVTRLYGPALLIGTPYAGAFTLVSVLASLLAGTPGTANIAMAFNETPTLAPSDVTIAVV